MLSALLIWPTTHAQQIMFDFDNAPLHVSLPLAINSGGVTATLSATGQGFSIQEANTMGFTPQGFGGNCIYPNSVFAADLLIAFDQTLSDLSILYACQELGCDDAATMRITAYYQGIYVGTNTRTATYPGTYPMDTLSCSFPQGFDSVVIHYDSPPPTCQDYGTIFLADNMLITLNTTGIGTYSAVKEIFLPNPVTHSTEVVIEQTGNRIVNWRVTDIEGKQLRKGVGRFLSSDKTSIPLKVESLSDGYYFLIIEGGDFFLARKFVLLSE